mmetsp:Transcript_24837/g.54089  ORF Transcript_24837/g.54089 Transcript_24837/m.54089 type:complete len:98 (-) Transcript_24837:121-414(-)
MMLSSVRFSTSCTYRHHGDGCARQGACPYIIHPLPPLLQEPSGTPGAQQYTSRVAAQRRSPPHTGQVRDDIAVHNLVPALRCTLNLALSVALVRVLP